MPPSKKDKKARTDSLLRQNVRLARCRWRGELGGSNLPELRKLSSDPGLSIASGEILLIAGRWYVTSAGLLRLANKNNCKGIHSSAVVQLCDADSHRWVFRAIVHKSPTSKGFVGYGDADPSNVSPLVHGAEMRVAETRAVNRALRKAYGIGLCSVEELGWAPRPSGPDRSNQRKRPLERKQRPSERSASPPRSSLPADPSTSARCRPGEGLCRRLLRNTNPA